MEEFFLCLNFFSQELYIIYHKQINVAIFLTESFSGVITNGINQLIGEFFTGNIKNSFGRIVFENLMANGMHQMGFTQANATIHKKWIVGFAWLLGYSQSCSMGNTVKITSNKIVENIFGIQG